MHEEKPMKQTIQQKREAEQKMVRQMIEIYCHGKHGSKKGQLCEQCTRLAEYSQKRAASCPRMEEKTFCSACPHPCYKPEMRRQIKDAMRYAGPRMLFYNPIAAIRHLILTKSI